MGKPIHSIMTPIGYKLHVTLIVCKQEKTVLKKLINVTIERTDDIKSSDDSNHINNSS